MMVSLIVAMDEGRGIGLRGKVPWKLSTDLRRFKQLTAGHHLIMGRKTFESIGKPLPGRMNIILTRDPAYQRAGCLVMHNLQDALELAESRCDEEVFIIGGGDLYAQALPLAGRLYLTRVHVRLEADTFFPEIRLEDWAEKQTQSFPASEKDQHPYTYQVFERLP